MSRSRIIAIAGAGLASTLTATALAGAGQPGADGVGDPFFPRAGNGGYEVDSYDIKLRYRSSGRIRVREVVEATVTTEGSALSRFNLDFRGPAVKSVKVNGAAADFERVGPELRITPASVLADGAGFKARIVFAGMPRQVTDPDGSKEGWTNTADGAVAVSEPIGTTSWLAVNDHPTDKAAYSVTLITPKRLVGISNGRLIKRTTGKRTRTRWQQPDPMASYLAVVAIGRFNLDRRRMDGIPYVGAADLGLRSETLTRLYKRTRRAHACMEEIAGPYPFASTGGIVDPSSLGFALEAQTRSYYPAPPSPGLVVHEISHQWYGNSVAVETWDQIWLNEGFATYMEWLCEERRGGRTTKKTFKHLYSTHPEAETGYWNPPPAAVPGPEKLFAISVYDRGAMALEVLRQTIGDEDFFEVLMRWATENEGGNVHTDDLLALIADVSGSVPPEFEDWLLDPGKPAKPGP